MEKINMDEISQILSLQCIMRIFAGSGGGGVGRQAKAACLCLYCCSHHL